MVLVAGEDGSLSPSDPQSEFAQTYNDGVGQNPASEGLVIFGETAGEPEEPQISTLNGPRVAPRAGILAAIEDTALRYAGHDGLRAADITVTDWLDLYRANIEIESAYQVNARSHAGAIGLGQLMPDTARMLGVDPYDWLQNLDGSARYLAMMLAEFGDMRLALAAYNAGPETVYAHAGVPAYIETQNHVRRVLAVFDRLQGATP